MDGKYFLHITSLPPCLYDTIEEGGGAMQDIWKGRQVIPKSPQASACGLFLEENYFFFLRYLSIFSTMLSGIFLSMGKNAALIIRSENAAMNFVVRSMDSAVTEAMVS